MAVTLRGMSDSEASHAVNAMTDEYVEDRIRAGEPADVARAGTQAEMSRFFPDGRPGQGHVLFAVEEGSAHVGMVWVGPHPHPARSDERDVAWLYDLEIDAGQRGRGLGRAALAALEEHLVANGYRELGLNVFGDNDTARNLYRSAGFREATVQMT
jgi:ribosomal protein S18 acetylase RimI-like enzyme